MAKEEYRAQPLGYELRDNGEGMPTLAGVLAPFNEWAEINSSFEGHFLERLAPTAFDKTISENRERMRCLFQHGKDPQIGDKPLGPISSLQAEERGVAYEVPLLDTSYNRDLVEMLKADPPVLGSSFRFEVLREHRDRKAAKSDYNPRGLPERTIQEVRMSEFGPVTFPAYSGATTGLRSLTDRMLSEKRADIPAISTLIDMYQCGQWFMVIEDDQDDQPDKDKMKQILSLLDELIQSEASENEGAENESAEMASADKRAAAGNAPPNDGAGSSHPIRRTPRGLVPLYTGRKEEDPSWRL